MPPPTQKEAPPDLLARVEEAQVRHIDLQFTDVVGGVKTVTIPASQLREAISHGTWFDGSSVDSFARTAESDMYLVPDPSTFQLLPWGDERTARLICWATTPDGEAYQGDPRGVLRRAVEDAERLGFEYHVGPEVEFFLLERTADGSLVPTRNDRSSYFDFSSDGNRDLRQRLVSALISMGIAVNTSHHEIAGGQHEIDIDAAPALKAADDLITFRYAIKAVAQQSGVIATFMPKPFDGKPGSGMHVHQSLVRLRDLANAFAGDDAYGLSEVAQHFIAGQLHHAAGISAVLAPLVNSYKRLVRGFEAPIFISWARTNRGALIRVPARRPRRGDPSRAAQSGPVVQPVSRVRGDAPVRARRHRAPAPTAAAGRGIAVRVRRDRARAAQRRRAPRQPQGRRRRARSRRGRHRRAWATISRSGSSPPNASSGRRTAGRSRPGSSTSTSSAADRMLAT